jgi:thiol-disulfide isomerase/thioredoxin
MSFWATWCDACQIELPQLEILYQKYRKDGFIALAITMDTAETVSEVPAAVERLGLTYPVLLDTESEVTAAYNPRNDAPLFLLIDRTGKTVYSHVGFVVSDVEDMEHEIRKALGKE